MLGWDDLRFVLAVHRARSMAGAARLLGVNQSTVGRRIAALEASLHTRIFFHAADGYQLTQAGEQMRARMLRMEEQALALERELDGSDEALSGTVTITGPDAFAAGMLVPILARFRQHHPQIELVLLCDERAMDLRRREADLALRIGRPGEGSLVARKVAPFCYGVYASKAYLQSYGRPRAGFAGHQIVGVQRKVSDRWLRKHAKDARVVLTTNSTTAHLNAVTEGVGLGVLPCYLAAREPSLVCIARPDASLSSALWLVMHRDLRHAARIRALTEALTSELGSLARKLSSP